MVLAANTMAKKGQIAGVEVALRGFGWCRARHDEEVY
jgi:hypothetical protein